MPKKTAKLKPINAIPTKGVVTLSKGEPKHEKPRPIEIMGKYSEG